MSELQSNEAQNDDKMIIARSQVKTSQPTYLVFSNLPLRKLLINRFYLFLVVLIIFSARSNAQIVYTDVNPDVLRTCTYPAPCQAAYLLDLNSDGINDFTFSLRERRFSCGNCSPNPVGSLGVRDSALVISTAQSWISDTIGGFDLNRPIDSSLAWTNTVHTLAQNGERCMPCANRPTLFFRGTQGITGTWINVSDKYLALKVKVGTRIFYGWIKLSVSIGSYLASIKIMEYAYNSTPNQPILAGQKPLVTGINENSFASSISLFPNPANNQLTIDFGNNNQDVDVSILDVKGKTMHSTTTNGMQQIDVDTKEFEAGIYVVKFKSADFIGTKRLMIAR